MSINIFSLLQKEVSKLWYEICEDEGIFEEGIEKIKMQYDLTI